MECQCLCEEIISNTAHLNCIRCEQTTSVNETWSEESDWVVSLSHDQHTDKTLVAINNEIATELSHILLPSY